jgi:hypothetical protein
MFPVGVQRVSHKLPLNHAEIMYESSGYRMKYKDETPFSYNYSLQFPVINTRNPCFI